MKPKYVTKEENVYICYGEDGLKGHLCARSIQELRTKIGIYNRFHEDKITWFKDPSRKKEHTVK